MRNGQIHNLKSRPLVGYRNQHWSGLIHWIIPNPWQQIGGGNWCVRSNPVKNDKSDMEVNNVTRRSSVNKQNFIGCRGLVRPQGGKGVLRGLQAEIRPIYGITIIRESGRWGVRTRKGHGNWITIVTGSDSIWLKSGLRPNPDFTHKNRIKNWKQGLSATGNRVRLHVYKTKNITPSDGKSCLRNRIVVNETKKHETLWAELHTWG